MKSVEGYLENLGFNIVEIKIYFSLLELGPSNISALSKHSNIPRTTIIRNLNKLLHKGVVTKTSKGDIVKYIAESPMKVGTLLHAREIELEENQRKLTDLKELLPTFINEILGRINSSSLAGGTFVVKYYEGKQGFIDAHNRTLESKDKLLWFLSNMNEWKKVFTDDYAYKFYVPERIKRRIFARTLAIDSPLARSIRANDIDYYREMRFLPAELKFKPTIIAYDSEVLIMISSEPHFSILIQHEAVAELFKSLCQFLWQTAT